MKKLAYIIPLLLFFGCEDVVDIDVPSTEPKLVIDASFDVYTTESPVRTDGFVKLSLTTDYFDNENKPVNDANVTITDLNSGTLYPFTSNGNAGYYQSTTNNFTPEFNKTYQLNVVYNNNTYTAETTLIPSVAIDNVEQGDATLFDENDTELIVSFTDDASREDFYVFDLDFGEFLTTSDEFFQGETFKFSYFYDDLSSGKEVVIKLNGADEQFYNYMDLILAQSGESSGGPFQTTPATIRGNIINTTNEDNYALGYFNLSETYEYTITIN
ncbi:MAG: DUF4249 family protein [Cellulophaga sp.]